MNGSGAAFGVKPRAVDPWRSRRSLYKWLVFSLVYGGPIVRDRPMPTLEEWAATGDVDGGPITEERAAEIIAQRNDETVSGDD